MTTLCRSACLLMLALVAHMSTAQILNVPGEYATIQQAIDAAAEGDTVIVAEGTYPENLEIAGKSIVLGSLFLLDEDESHIANTIIDGSGAANPDRASTIHLDPAPTAGSTIAGFTITGGEGSVNADNGYLGGGGVAVFKVGATIRNNRIVENRLEGSRPYGAGIVVYSPPLFSPVFILNNVVQDNQIVAEKFGAGGGIFTYQGTSSDDSWIYIEGNFVVGNSMHSDTRKSKGGGMALYHGAPWVRHNVIANNRAERGGGVEYSNHNKTMPEPHFVNNTIVFNWAEWGGGIHNRFLDARDKPLEVINSILWGNGAESDPQAFHTEIQYSVVQGGFDGVGNMQSDPQFLDSGSYQIAPGSPCVDAGHPGVQYNDPEDVYSPGKAQWPAYGSLRNDVGAYAVGSALSRAQSTSAAPGPSAFDSEASATAYPNPFRQATTFRVEVHTPSTVVLEVFDLLGRSVGTVRHESVMPGIHEMLWMAPPHLAGGGYLYVISAGNRRHSGALVLAR